jgi:hypothetical protein
MKHRMNEQELAEALNLAMNKISQLEQRIACIRDEAQGLSNFISSLPTLEPCDEAWHLMNNIEIACDLDNQESLDLIAYNRDITKN